MREEWEDLAECLNHPELSWFAGESLGRGKVSIEAQDQRVRAREICLSECPVNVQCIEAGLAVGAPNGVWGGVQSNTTRWKRIRRSFRAGEDWVRLYLYLTDQAGLLESKR